METKLEEFVKTFVEEQKPIDPDVAEYINSIFWSLIGNDVSDLDYEMTGVLAHNIEEFF